MEIIYSQNPSYSLYVLDDKDKEILGLKLELEDCLDQLTMGQYILTRDMDINEKVSKALSYLDRFEEDDEVKESKFYIDKANKWLKDTDLHDGDCVCISGSCIKCHVDRLLGIDTTFNIRKHDFHWIRSAFLNAGPDALCADIIEWFKSSRLKDMNNVQRFDDVIQHLERYKTEYIDSGKVGNIKACPV